MVTRWWLPVLIGLREKRRRIRMTTFQENNAVARSSQEDTKVRYSPRPILRAAGAAAFHAVMMAA